jgi:hypothetical protein
MFATATNAVWSGEFLRLGFTVPSGSTVTANDLQGLNSSFLSVMTHAFLEHSAHAC